MPLYDAKGEEIPTPNRKPAIGFGAHIYNTRGKMEPQASEDRKDRTLPTQPQG